MDTKKIVIIILVLTSAVIIGAIILDHKPEYNTVFVDLPAAFKEAQKQDEPVKAVQYVDAKMPAVQQEKEFKRITPAVSFENQEASTATASSENIVNSPLSEFKPVTNDTGLMPQIQRNTEAPDNTKTPEGFQTAGNGRLALNISASASQAFFDALPKALKQSENTGLSLPSSVEAKKLPVFTPITNKTGPVK